MFGPPRSGFHVRACLFFTPHPARPVRTSISGPVPSAIPVRSRPAQPFSSVLPVRHPTCLIGLSPRGRNPECRRRRYGDADAVSGRVRQRRNRLCSRTYTAVGRIKFEQFLPFVVNWYEILLFL